MRINNESRCAKKSRIIRSGIFYGEEDIELSHRLKKFKGELKIDLDQKIYHAVSTTVGKNWAKIFIIIISIDFCW